MLRCNHHHLKGCDVRRIVVILAQSDPVHGIAVDGDFPPLTFFFLSLSGVFPAGAEQIACHEVFSKLILDRDPLIVVVLHRKDIGAVGANLSIIVKICYQINQLTAEAIYPGIYQPQGMMRGLPTTEERSYKVLLR